MDISDLLIITIGLALHGSVIYTDPAGPINDRL